jgi:putative DNA primase/helicase
MAAIPKTVSREDAEEALGELKRLLEEFPFCDKASKSAALSGLITPQVRALLTCSPLHASSAPTPGTGKSFLFDIPAGMAIGDAMPVMAAGNDPEETEKRFNTEFLKGVTLLSIDNVTTPLGGDALCQAIERPMVLVRHR